MKSFIAETWSFVTGQYEHPIYRHEVEGWSYVRFWRGLRRGCLPLVALVAGGSAFCCGLFGLSSIRNPPELPEDLLVTLLFVLIGLGVGGELVRWLTGLLATVLAATTISAEVEAETFGLLRLTPISAREIVLAKFGATFRQFRLPLVVIAVVRAVVALGMAGLLVALIVANIIDAPPSPGALPPLASLPGGQAVLLVAAGLAVLLAVLVAAVYYLLGPALQTFLFTALGMFASSLSGTRAGGLMLAGGSRVALWMVSYVLGQVLSAAVSLLLFPLMAVSTTPSWVTQLDTVEPAALVLASALALLAWVLIVAAAHLATALGLLAATVRRAERLPRP